MDTVEGDVDSKKERRIGNQRRELILKLPGGAQLTVRGYDILVVLLAIAVGVFGYMMIENKANAASEHNQIISSMKEQKEALGEMVFILSLSQEQREKLRIEMPISLRRKLNERQ